MSVLCVCVSYVVNKEEKKNLFSVWILYIHIHTDHKNTNVCNEVGYHNESIKDEEIVLLSRDDSTLRGISVLWVCVCVSVCVHIGQILFGHFCSMVCTRLTSAKLFLLSDWSSLLPHTKTLSFSEANGDVFY